jgi:hypothetical protein
VRQIARKERSVISSAVLQDTPCYINARILFVRELYVWICLVVAKQHVEARLVLLDQIVLKGQRFFVVMHLNERDVTRFRYEAAGFRFCQPVFVEVAPNAAAKILRLADVENVSRSVFVEVNAWLGGKLRDFFS